MDFSGPGYWNKIGGPKGDSSHKGSLGHWNDDGSWTWDSGPYAGQTVPANQAQANKGLYDQYSASPEEAAAAQEKWKNENYVDPVTGKKRGELGGAPGGVTGESPIDRAMQGFVPKQISATAPGATLDTANADAERTRLQGLLEQLQQQAATGGGEWEQTLAEATQRAQQTASALGQSNPNVDYGSAVTNINNAQAGAQQRAAGQDTILRGQSMQAARAQLGDLLGGQGEQDIEQARLDAAARQQRRASNAELVAQARARAEGVAGAVGQAFMSDGGTVPGQPAVFGDDERNDTVPAMLSPGEIVVPRSQASDPEAAARFAHAVAARRGVQHLAEGTPDYGLEDLPGPTGEETAEIITMPHVGINDYYNRIGGGPQQASIENGGLLNVGNFDANRAASLGLADQLGGAQPTVTSQQLVNAQDDTIAGAMAQAQQTAASNASNVLSAAVAGQQGMGGEAAATRGNEQARAQQLLQKTLTQQRGRDLAMALAQQQAGWRNTALNAGLLSAQQQAIMNAISGGAQAIGALSDAGAGRDSEDEPFELDSGDRPSDGWYDEPAGPTYEEPAGDYPEPDSDSQHAAHGGEIHSNDERARARRFLSLIGRAA